MLVYIFAVLGLAYSISFNLNGMFVFTAVLQGK